MLKNYTNHTLKKYTEHLYHIYNATVRQENPCWLLDYKSAITVKCFFTVDGCDNKRSASSVESKLLSNGMMPGLHCSRDVPL